MIIGIVINLFTHHFQAIDLILQPPSATTAIQKDWDLTLARREWMETKNAEKALTKIRKSINTVEAQLLVNLKARGKDLVGALNIVRHFGSF